MDEVKLDSLVQRINSVVRMVDEYALSTESAVAEFVSDLGYNECEYTTEHLTEDATAILKAIPKAKRRQAILECSAVEQTGVFYQENEVFGQTLGETEDELPHELIQELEALSADEYEYVRRHVDAYMRETDRRYVVLNHTYDRFVLILDEEKLAAWCVENEIKIPA